MMNNRVETVEGLLTYQSENQTYFNAMWILVELQGHFCTVFFGENYIRGKTKSPTAHDQCYFVQSSWSLVQSILICNESWGDLLRPVQFQSIRVHPQRPKYSYFNLWHWNTFHWQQKMPSICCDTWYVFTCFWQLLWPSIFAEVVKRNIQHETCHLWLIIMNRG